ncbi:MAG: hypothetical protein AB8B87_11005 [Granulosicoccus sp.]
MNHPDAVLGMVLLLILIPILGIALYKLTHHKQVSNNGKVVITRKWHLSFPHLTSRRLKYEKQRKPFTRSQIRILRLVYSVHEAAFGLIIFAFGLGLVSKVFLSLTSGTNDLFEPITMALAVLGLAAMPIGVLLIYFRNSDNPFDER